MSDIPIGVVTISDRASRGLYEDKGGPGIEAALAELLASPWRPARRLVPDERPAIEAALIALADVEGCPLILTTGGTGPALRDVTPEATEAVCDRMLPGFGELMRTKSLARSADRDPVAPDRRHAGREPDHQPARQAGGDPHLSRRGLRRRALLHRPDRRGAAGDEPEILRGVPAEGVGTALRSPRLPMQLTQRHHGVAACEDELVDAGRPQFGFVGAWTAGDQDAARVPLSDCRGIGLAMLRVSRILAAETGELSVAGRKTLAPPLPASRPRRHRPARGPRPPATPA